jgi:hypothetical protein
LPALLGIRKTIEPVDALEIGRVVEKSVMNPNRLTRQGRAKHDKVSGVAAGRRREWTLGLEFQVPDQIDLDTSNRQQGSQEPP